MNLMLVVSDLATVRAALAGLVIVGRILLLVAVTMVSANLAVDLLYGVLDPRLRSVR